MSSLTHLKPIDIQRRFSQLNIKGKNLRKPIFLWYIRILFGFYIWSASTGITYIFTTPTCTTTICILESCALNAEFQHFILRFNK
jgi:hypothetical protein